jgi:predicted RNA-binding Zn-ribbon protein involved in translation (DUF1610 family)
MELVEASCTKCGANIKVDPTQDAANCDYCGAAFIVEKAINNYNIANAQITAQTMNVNIGSEDFVIEGGVLKKYKGNDTHVVIPETVKEIQAHSFENGHYIKSIFIPDSVKIIRAYRDLHNKSYGIGIFYKGGENLTDVSISSSIKYLNICTFWNCRKLTNLRVDGEILLWEGTKKDERYLEINSQVNSTKIPDEFNTQNEYKAKMIMKFLQRYLVDAYGNYHVDCRPIFVNGIDVSIKLRQVIENDNIRVWRAKGLCPHCGGNFSLFGKKCKQCGKPMEE